MPVANGLNKVVLNSVNQLPGTQGRGDQTVQPSSLALVPSVIMPHLEQIPHHPDFDKTLGTAL